ncbi:hypothetical protein M5689_021602 [Euphorbia peplus]|nr:hypothetical protein M5689_021602 [Euphorbia peplus]
MPYPSKHAPSLTFFAPSIKKTRDEEEIPIALFSILKETMKVRVMQFEYGLKLISQAVEISHLILMNVVNPSCTSYSLSTIPTLISQHLLPAVAQIISRIDNLPPFMNSDMANIFRFLDCYNNQLHLLNSCLATICDEQRIILDSLNGNHD